jgi:hypothetical protein
MDRLSIATQDQNYVEELVRYVHLNPVHAGSCKDLIGLEKYHWCGHGALMGLEDRTFQDTKTVRNVVEEMQRLMHERRLRILPQGNSGIR